MKRNSTPYLAHVFVCVNDRKGERKSCADANAAALKSHLKNFITEKGWKSKVRVSTSGCLGLCADGPNIIIYPQCLLFSEVSPSDLSEIEAEIEIIVEQNAKTL